MTERESFLDPPPLNPGRVHWPLRIGREELMIEAPPDIERAAAEYLVRELLEQSGLAAEEPDEVSIELGIRHGFRSIRFVTMNFELEGAVYRVSVQQDRATVRREAE